MARYILCIEEPFPCSVIFVIASLLFIALVGLDKLIVFRRVIGMERRLCLSQQFQPAPVNHVEYLVTVKRFTTSDMHFKMTIYLPVVLIAIGVLGFNGIYKGEHAVNPSLTT